jgi:hypothetical protein
MTQGEFDAIGWTGQMKCHYKDGTYAIGSVDFEERLVGLSDYCTGADVGDLQWVRCENIELASDNDGYYLLAEIALQYLSHKPQSPEAF